MKIGENKRRVPTAQHAVLVTLYLAIKRLPVWFCYRILCPLAATVSVFVPSFWRPALSNMRAVSTRHGFFAPLVWAKNAWWVLLHAAYTWYDHVYISQMDLGDFNKGVEVFGRENLTEAVESGRGVMLVAGHSTGLFLAAHKLFDLGVNPFCPTEPLPNPALSRLTQRLRTSQGLECQVLEASTIREILTRLRGGGSVVMVIDRDIQGNGIAVPFMGRITQMPKGPAAIAKKTGCLVVPATWERLGTTRFKITMHPAIDPSCFDDVESLAREMLRPIEEEIRRNPSQWIPLERIW